AFDVILEFADNYDADEHYELGDTVRVTDPGLNINTPQRIVKESHDPFIRMIGKVSIANFIPNIVSKITALQKNTVLKNRVYNGNSISPENGFVSERSDKKARMTSNATEGVSLDVGDGTGSYTPVFYVHIEADGTAKLYLVGNAKFTGEVNGSSIIGGTITIGTGDNVLKADSNGIYLGNALFADAPFKVSTAGAAEASNLIITGGSISVATNISVGNNIYIGTPSSFADKGLYFYDSTTGVYTSIGVFLNEYAPSVFELLISNQDNKINIYSSDTIFIGDEGTMTYLTILPTEGYFTLFSASATDSRIKHGGTGALHIEHEGGGDLWIEHTGTGVLKIESQQNMSIRSYLGVMFAQGTWRFDSTIYIGTADEANRILKKSEVEALVPGGATGSFTSADGKTVTVSNGRITSIV
ncbi:MAG: phage tail protein, partial [Gammaproteobacteria bacterium]|nr:phage tail protein [Gammaproteobacteria bacterium]